MKLFNELISLNEASILINNNRSLAIAGTETTLTSLPRGNWIGGTIPYFMTKEGGKFDTQMVFVSDLTDISSKIMIKTYNTDSIDLMPSNNFRNGLSYLIIPGFSEIHTHYAINTPSIKGLMDSPVYGWISGIDVNNIGKESPKVVNGNTLEVLNNEAICMHIELYQGLSANIDIINIFSQAENGDVITFEKVGFSCTDCFVNGKKTNLAQYIKEKEINTQLPIVADFSGTSINVSLQSVNKTTGITTFYAPVQPGIEYRFAGFHNDYLKSFNKEININSKDIALSCNCILNYLYSNLEGKSTGNFHGPITFGEVAYILVNQTMVYVSIN
ncbi:MAG: hypothetical protein JW717_14290 [Marinilabiliaceae bacterium]|nr:hypothetical protein [Marinilabiliaceae bacterium]